MKTLICTLALATGILLSGLMPVSASAASRAAKRQCPQLKTQIQRQSAKINRLLKNHKHVSAAMTKKFKVAKRTHAKLCQSSIVTIQVTACGDIQRSLCDAMGGTDSMCISKVTEKTFSSLSALESAGARLLYIGDCRDEGSSYNEPNFIQ